MAVRLESTRDDLLPVPRRRRKLEPWNETALPVVKERANADLWFFLTEVLGIHILQPEPHGKLCNWLMRPRTSSPGFGLVLMPRLTLKTSVITEGYTLWRHLRDETHSERTLISSDLRANAKKMGLKVRGYLEANPRIHQLYGNLKREPGWTDEFFTTQRDHESREPSFMTAGMDAVVVSLHFDRIIGDDVQNNTNVNTKEAIEKVVEYTRLFEGLIELPEINPMAETLLVGTRWDDADVYGQLLREHSGMEDEEFMKVLLEEGEATFGDLDVFFRGAKHADGSPLWSMFTDEFLAKKQKRLGAYLFAANYLNDPVPVENATFRREWFLYWERLPEVLDVFMVVDPAISEKKHGDYSAILVAGVDSAKRIYILDAWHGRVNPKALIDRMFLFYQDYSPTIVGLETVSFQKALKYPLYDEMARKNMWMPIRELKPDNNATKEMRIRALQPDYESGRVLHKRGLSELEFELLRFPRGQHDDLIDALAYLRQMLSAPPKQGWKARGDYVPENRITGY